MFFDVQVEFSFLTITLLITTKSTTVQNFQYSSPPSFHLSSFPLILISSSAEVWTSTARVWTAEEIRGRGEGEVEQKEVKVERRRGSGRGEVRKRERREERRVELLSLLSEFGGEGEEFEEVQGKDFEALE